MKNEKYKLVFIAKKYSECYKTVFFIFHFSFFIFPMLYFTSRITLAYEVKGISPLSFTSHTT